MTLKFGKMALGAIFASVLTLPLGATPVGTGSFGLSGNLEVTPTSVLFGLGSPPTAGGSTETQHALISADVNTGGFATLVHGQIASIQNITSMPAFPSGAISIPQWIVLPNNIDLDLTNVVFNTTVPICSTTGASDAPGTTCRVMLGSTQSPILLTELGPGIGVYAQIGVLGNAYSGSASTGTSPFNGIISDQFTAAGETTISGLLNTFITQGFIEGDNYSGGFSVNIVPEPGMLAGVGLGMLVLGSLGRKIRKNRS
jgi:hypothetical protein